MTQKRLIALAVTGLASCFQSSDGFGAAVSYEAPALMPYRGESGNRKERKAPRRKSGVAQAKREAKKQRNKR